MTVTSTRRRLEQLEQRMAAKLRGGELRIIECVIVEPGGREIHPPPIPADWLAEQRRIADESACGFHVAFWPPPGSPDWPPPAEADEEVTSWA